MMQSMFHEKNRPFYQSSFFLNLDPIAKPVYRDFIQGHFRDHDKHLSGTHIDLIYEWSRGQTAAIQKVCNIAFQEYDPEKEIDISQAFDQAVSSREPGFMYLPHLLTGTQLSVLKAIAIAEPVANPTATDFLSRFGIPLSTMRRTLLSLQDKELVIRDTDGYYVDDILLSRWLAKLP